MESMCPSCADVRQFDDTNHCTECGYHAEPTTAEQSVPQAFKPTVRAKKIPVDVQLAVTNDRTGSSEAFAKGIPVAFEMIVDALEKKARSVSIHLQSHGDLDEGMLPLLLVDGGTPEEAKDAMCAVTYDGGGVAEEHHLDAIEHLMDSVPWADDPTASRGALLLFATADSKPLRSGQSAADLGREIKQRGLLLYLICEPTKQLRELASAAEGLVFPISNEPDAAELRNAAHQLGKSIQATLSQVPTENATVRA
jgi:hypothetical protein